VVGNSHICVCSTWTHIWPSAEDNLELHMYVYIRSFAVDRRNNTQVYMFSFALLAYQWHLNSCVVSPGKRLKTDFKWFILRLIHSRHVNPSIRILATCWKDSTGGFNSTASRSSLPAICKACVCDSDSFGSVLCG